MVKKQISRQVKLENSRLVVTSTYEDTFQPKFPTEDQERVLVMVPKVGVVSTSRLTDLEGRTISDLPLNLFRDIVVKPWDIPTLADYNRIAVYVYKHKENDGYNNYNSLFASLLGYEPISSLGFISFTNTEFIFRETRPNNRYLVSILEDDREKEDIEIAGNGFIREFHPLYGLPTVTSKEKINIDYKTSGFGLFNRIETFGSWALYDNKNQPEIGERRITLYAWHSAQEMGCIIPDGIHVSGKYESKFCSHDVGVHIKRKG